MIKCDWCDKEKPTKKARLSSMQVQPMLTERLRRLRKDLSVSRQCRMPVLRRGGMVDMTDKIEGFYREKTSGVEIQVYTDMGRKHYVCLYLYINEVNVIPAESITSILSQYERIGDKRAISLKEE